MGPRPFGRGEFGRVAPAISSGLLQWGRDLSAAESCAGWPSPSCGPCFNGAATFRPRRAEHPPERILEYVQLQWGRDLSAAERWNSGTWTIPPRKLQWGRDLSAAESVTYPTISLAPQGFNGAATFRPRRVSRTRQYPWPPRASMGPRPFGRGEIPHGPILKSKYLASMGPRPFGRGEIEPRCR